MQTDSPVPPPDVTADDPMAACRAAQREFVGGRTAEAHAILRAVLQRHPGFYAPYVVLGQMAEQQRDFPGAIAAYEQASALNPGHALPFTRRALLKLRLTVGDPPAPQRYAGGPFVAMSTLGLNGRFGNQLLQYGVLRLYAERVGAQVLVPDWIGRDLFGHTDALSHGVAPLGVMKDSEVTDVVAGRSENARLNVDVNGYFCGNAADWAAGRETFQRCFEPAGKVLVHARGMHAKVAARGRTLVAVHIRHGDYGQGRFWIAPPEWYVRWLREVWHSLDRPVLYLATDDPAVARAFDAFHPVTASQLGVALPGAEFFADHWMLRQADVLATSNSTFSGTAALLNRKPVRCVRPDRAMGGVRPYAPWAEPLLLE